MVRCIQVGLGVWGLNWAEEVLPEVPAVELVAGVDPSAGAREAAAAGLGIRRDRLFPDLAAAARAVDADFVLAPVRTDAHHAVATEALRLGLHVLVEKPFATSAAEARAMVAEAERAGRLLMVSQNYRFQPAPLAVAGMIARRDLGPVNLVSVEFRRHGPSQGYRYWDMPHPLIADMSIHHFDLMRMVLGADARRLSCRSWNPGGTPFVHDPIGVVTVEFDDGTILSYRGSWVSGGENTPWAGEWRMDCAEGEILWTSRDHVAGRPAAPDRLEIRRRGAPAERPALPDVALADRAGALDAFVRAITTGERLPHLPVGRDNLGSFAMVEAAIRSAARDGAWVDVAEVLG